METDGKLTSPPPLDGKRMLSQRNKVTRARMQENEREDDERGEGGG